jgi:uncharacterized protein YkwD
LLLWLAPLPLRADVIGAVNEVRSRGCEQRPTAPPLSPDARLDEAARLLAQGGELRAAMAKAGYRAVESTAIHVSDAGAGDDAVARVLGQRFCSGVADPAFRHLGVARRDKQLWILLAAPFTAPAAEDAAAVSARVLQLTNEARTRPRRCGGKTFAAVSPLGSASMLDKAALGHAQDMATHNYFAHTGRDGSTPAQRATRAGYRWRAIGENIAAGPATAEIVVRGWLDSPEHCSNLMSPRYTAMGIAYSVNPASKQAIYWVQMFGAPR